MKQLLCSDCLQTFCLTSFDLCLSVAYSFGRSQRLRFSILGFCLKPNFEGFIKVVALDSFSSKED